jgi:short-subunit dehydrogenase
VKRILITGCSSGIGRALAVELGDRGHHVIATARNVETIRDLPAAQHLALDVTLFASVQTAVAYAGEIDVLINNAGIGMWGPVEAASESEIRGIFETNVFGPLRMAHAVLPQMRARRTGAIYQISSAVAQRSNALLGHYAATKAALEAYSQAMRIELAGFGISVTNVILGAVETSFGANRRNPRMDDYGAVIDAMSKRIQANRREPATATEVAGVIANSIDAGNAPMRLNASADAETLVAERRAMDDAEWERNSLAFMSK